MAALLAGALSISLTHAQEQGAEPDAIDATFSACVAPGLTAEARLALLNDAGWRTAGDTAETRVLEAVAKAIRYPLQPTSTFDNLRKVIAETLATPPELSLAPDQPFALQDVATLMATSDIFRAELVQPDGGVLLKVAIGSGGDGPDTLLISCDMLLIAPQGDDRAEGLVMASGGAVENRTQRVDLEPGIATVNAGRDRDSPLGYVKVYAREFFPDARHNAVFNDVALGAMASLYAKTTYGGFSLK